jgi:tetratricopeptide (TPR) repeat protein
MKCPYCQTENREDREKCYACDKDISMLRLIVNKALHHYNLALEHAERGRYDEAIAELSNSIDLDRRFENAHVVLGTVHAKKGDFEKARAAWAAALALNPELNKAHNYIERAQQVQKQLPVLQTLQVLVFGLLVVAVGLAIALILVARPNPSIARFREAQALYEAQSYGKALGVLKQIRAEAGSNDVAASAAGLLDATIESDLRQQVRMIQDLKYHEEFASALSAIADLESREPDEKTSAALAIIRSDISHYYRDRIDQLYADYTQGRVDFGELAERIEEFLAAYPEVPEKDELRAYLAKARETEAQTAIEAVRQNFAETHDADSALTEIARISAENPGVDAVKRGRAEIVDLILGMMFDQLNDLMENGDYAAASGLLSEISDRAGEFRDIVDVSGPVDLATRVLEEARRGARLRLAETLALKGETGDAEEALLQLMADDSLTTAERQLVESLDLQLERRKLEDAVKALKGREKQFLALKMSDAEASETLSMYEAMYLVTPDSNTEARARILSAAAAAALCLGDEATAEGLLTRLDKDEQGRRNARTLRNAAKARKN